MTRIWSLVPLSLPWEEEGNLRDSEGASHKGADPLPPFLHLPVLFLPQLMAPVLKRIGGGGISLDSFFLWDATKEEWQPFWPKNNYQSFPSGGHSLCSLTSHCSLGIAACGMQRNLSQPTESDWKAESLCKVHFINQTPCCHQTRKACSVQWMALAEMKLATSSVNLGLFHFLPFSLHMSSCSRKTLECSGAQVGNNWLIAIHSGFSAM